MPGFPIHFPNLLFKITFILGILLLQWGCATRYHAWDGKEGYFETDLDQQQQATITFTANQRSSANRTAIHVLYRAAELTQEKGFDSFIILSFLTGFIPDFIENRDCSGTLTFQDTPRPLAEVKIRFYKTNQAELPTTIISATEFIQKNRRYLNSDAFDTQKFLSSFRMDDDFEDF